MTLEKSNANEKENREMKVDARAGHSIEEMNLDAIAVEKVDIDADFMSEESSVATETNALEVAAGMGKLETININHETPTLMCDIEAILFISSEPVPLETLAEVTGSEGEELAHAVEAVRQKFSGAGAGIVFAEVASGYTFRTADQARGAVERFCERPVEYSLSPAAMETLAIVAYLQPVTRPEIARIRGVGADTVVGTLVDKGLLTEAGRHEETGAIRYRTTAAFEKLFGLPDLASLPPIDGFEASPEDVEALREKLYLAAEKRQ